MTPLASLRADAEALARQLPDASLSAEAADVIHPGAAGRRRAGSGEQFWQYRHYAQTDAADRIDWRRSARGDDYFVRETELETARTVLFWADPHAGFDWAGEIGRKTKAEAARTHMLAVAILLAKAGERVGVLNSGRSPSLGKSAADRLAEDLANTKSDALTPPKGRSLAVIASDFYDGAEAWAKRLEPLASKCEHGVLYCITDPVEHSFPYTGRTRFKRPGTAISRIFGRAETVREDYLNRLRKHMRELEQLAGQMGWALVRHRTDQDPLRGAAALQFAIERFGARL